MSFVVVLFCILFRAADLVQGIINPYEVGEHVVNATTILNIQAIQLDYNLRVFAPNETGTFRAVYFLSGFDGKNACRCKLSDY